MSFISTALLQLKAATEQSTIPMSDPILVALSVPCEMRSKQDLMPIIDFVKGLKFFHSFSSYPETVEKIASRLELSTFLRGTTIFSEGEPGDLFFVILDGQVSIIKKKRLHAAIDLVTENVLLVKLGSGQHFGENALDSEHGLRSASAVASKQCNLLVLHRDDYQSILSFFRVQLREAVMKTLNLPSSIFNHLPKSSLEKLSEVVVVHSFPPNGCIFEAGKRVSSLMIVKSGLVRLVKSVYQSDIKQLTKDVDFKLRSLSAASGSFLIQRTSSNHHARGSFAASYDNDDDDALAPLSYFPPMYTASNNVLGGINGGNGLFSKPVSLIDPMENTPPGYWILTRSDDFIAASRNQHLLRGKQRHPYHHHQYYQPQASPQSQQQQQQSQYRMPPVTTTNKPRPPAASTSSSSSPNHKKTTRFNNKPNSSNNNSNSHSHPDSAPRSPSREIVLPTVMKASFDLSEEGNNSHLRDDEEDEDEATPTYSRSTTPNNVSSPNYLQRGKDKSSNQVRQQIAFAVAAVNNSKGTKPHHAPMPNSSSNKPHRHRPSHSQQVEFTVAVLMSGDVFGEIAILDPEYPTPVTALASTEVEIYCIDYDILVQLGINKDDRIMKSLLDDWKFRNPPPQEINKRFQAKYEWEIKRKQVLEPFLKSQK